MSEDWMAKNVNNFTGHFLKRYERTGSLRESLMWAYTKTLAGALPSELEKPSEWPDFTLAQMSERAHRAEHMMMEHRETVRRVMHWYPGLELPPIPAAGVSDVKK